MQSNKELKHETYAHTSYACSVDDRHSPAFAQHHFTAAEAHAHIGETAMVCGEVVSTRYASSTKGHPTSSTSISHTPPDLHHPHLGEDRGKFGAPKETYRGKHACVTGHISVYRGVPEVVASDPTQITSEGK